MSKVKNLLRGENRFMEYVRGDLVKATGTSLEIRIKGEGIGFLTGILILNCREEMNLKEPLTYKNGGLVKDFMGSPRLGSIQINRNEIQRIIILKRKGEVRATYEGVDFKLRNQNRISYHNKELLGGWDLHRFLQNQKDNFVKIDDLGISIDEAAIKKTRGIIEEASRLWLEETKEKFQDLRVVVIED